MVLHYSSKQVGSAVNTVVLDVPHTNETFDHVQHNLKALQNPTELASFRGGVHYSDIMRLLLYCVVITKCPHKLNTTRSLTQRCYRKFRGGNLATPQKTTLNAVMLMNWTCLPFWGSDLQESEEFNRWVHICSSRSHFGFTSYFTYLWVIPRQLPNLTQHLKEEPEEFERKSMNLPLTPTSLRTQQQKERCLESHDMIRVSVTAFAVSRTFWSQNKSSRPFSSSPQSLKAGLSATFLLW